MKAQDVVGAAKLEILLAEPLQLGLLVGREARALAGTHLGPLQPGAERFVAHPQLPGHPGDDRLVVRILSSELLDHLHGPLLQLRRVPLCCGSLLFHDSILASKVWNLRGSQAGCGGPTGKKDVRPGVEDG